MNFEPAPCLTADTSSDSVPPVGDLARFCPQRRLCRR